MFNSEAKMIKPVVQWLRSLQLIVRSEFVTPWGICDLVGLSFNKHNVARRLRHGQTRPVTSLTRAALLHRIPDVEGNGSVTLDELIQECAPAIPAETVIKETLRLEADHFLVRGTGNRLQKLNGWIPLQKRLIAVELKLNRIEEAMSQAENNLHFAEESYVALPADVAYRVSQKPARWAASFSAGVGLVSVTSRSCHVVVRSRRQSSKPDEIVQFYCTEKFWRNRPRGS